MLFYHTNEFQNINLYDIIFEFFFNTFKLAKINITGFY